jgi:transposase
MVLQSSPIWKRKRNFNYMGMNAPHYYETLQQEFTRLHGLGWTFRQIAAALDISVRTVTAWREELDLPRRPRGRRPRKPRG